MLPDGRGMTVAIGSFADDEGRIATMDVLRTFADRVILTLRPAQD